MMRLTLYVLLCLAAHAMASSNEVPDRIGHRIVQVHATYQTYNELMPWQKQPPATRTGYGIVIRDGLVLAPEHLVRDHTLVELRRPLSGEKIQAMVTAADWQTDLCLLAYPAGAVPGVTNDVVYSGVLEEGATVALHQFDRTSNVEQGSGRVMRSLVSEIPDAPAVSLQFTVLAEIDINGSGAPVTINNQLAGMVLAYERGTRTARVLPARTLERYANDVLNPPYRGFAGAGFFWRALIDPVKRSYLGLTEEHDERGIIVLNTMPHAPAHGVLKPNDVILACNDIPLDNMGFYEDDTYGRMSFVYMIKERLHPGETARVQVMRDGKIVMCNMVLARRVGHEDLIPENIAGDPPAYLIEGGLLLRELSGRYLRAHGAEWTRRVDPRLVYYYNQERYNAERLGDRVVILAGVLPDPINVDYHGLRENVVTHVNGQAIRNMHDAIQWAEQDGAISRISLKGAGLDVVIDTNTLAEANQRIARQYGISELRYPDRQELPASNE